MCGIFAYFSKNNITQIFLEHLTAQGMKCRLRGPDNTVSRVIGEDVFLLFHRLKINDMSESGNQPLVHPDDYNLTLICNGEIYNRKPLLMKIISIQNLLAIVKSFYICIKNME